ncbi:MAG: flagellar biosynthesis protein FlhA [Planctomycetes bacterium]|nr:flagellar biosynthesis protein FlhA [Planctomycetota bacterium]
MNVRTTQPAQSPLVEAGGFLKRYADWMIALGVLGLVVTLVTPIPAMLLDLLLALSVTCSLLILLVSMSTKAASELSVFPTILLLSTLFRLGLNVASTRLILSGEDPGSVIHAFGEYVAGENITVGLIVFLILVIIQFVVITKGAGRVSEVAARFVLDAMPGKQMAIDADLNSGLIDADEARRRRAEVAGEAEFYGAMDGASKFVRGDAIAGLLITALNLVGGIAMATLNGMSISEAGTRYSLLSIGDGLVTQIPALLVSTASAILVTKASSSQGLGYNVFSQVSGRPRATLIASGMVFAIGLLPGMPALPFFVLASMLAVAWRSTSNAELRDAAAAASVGSKEKGAKGAAGDAKGGEKDAESVEELLRVDRLSLEIGYRLIPLVQDASGAGILDHIAQLRRRFATNEGLVLPPVRIKDNIRLGASAYRVLVGGQEVARGEIEPGHLLAMDSGAVSGPIQGKATKDPAFGLPAKWIPENMRDEAEVLGYTVIDPTSVLVTHLSEVIRASVGDVITRDDVKELVASAKKVSPAVVEELIPDKIGYGEIQAILRNLVRDGVSVRNMPVILEVVADHVGKIKDADQLTELVRQRLGRAICETHADRNGTVYAITLDPGIEARLASAIGPHPDPESPPVNPAYLQKLVERVGDSIAQGTKSGKNVVLLVRSGVRRFLNELVRASLPKVAVLSYSEVVPARAVETLGIVKLDE